MQITNIILPIVLAATASSASVPHWAREITIPTFQLSRRANNTASAAGGADFGKCKPTMDFQLGRAGRKATEGTFLPTDPLVAQGQQDALNPNIITNRICDQLTNVCGANAAAKSQCQAAKAKVQSLGTKDASTATAFNSALGF